MLIRAVRAIFVLVAMVVGGFDALAQSVVEGSSGVPTVSLAGLTKEPVAIAALVAEAVAVDIGPEQVIQFPPSAFKPHLAAQTYELGSTTHTWFWFRVAPGGSSELHDWQLSVGKPFLDRVTLHHKGVDGRWTALSAGDSIPNRDWPVRSLSPEFVLPHAASGGGDYLLSISSNRPMRLTPSLQRSDAHFAESQLDLVVLGVFLGAAILALLVSATFALSYRDTRYAWYALYVFLSFMTVASHLGLAGRLFWPGHAEWLQYSTLSLGHACVLVQTHFVRSMFLGDRNKSALARAAAGVIAVGVVILLGSFAVDDVQLVSKVFVASVAANVLITFSIVIRSVMDRVLAAWLWLVAYCPLVVIFVLTVVPDLGSAWFGWLPSGAPVLAVMFEVLVLLVALHLHGKRSHASAVRSSTLAKLDPLTGFVVAAQLEAVAHQASIDAKVNKTVCAVAYVRVMPVPGDEQEPASERLKRVVRALNTACTEADAVVRVTDDVFALLMPGVSSTELRAERLSRLVALGLMDRGNARSKSPVMFRVVGATFDPSAITWAQLGALLLLRVSDDVGWDGRSIRHLRASEQTTDATNPHQLKSPKF